MNAESEYTFNENDYLNNTMLIISCIYASSYTKFMDIITLLDTMQTFPMQPTLPPPSLPSLSPLRPQLQHPRMHLLLSGRLWEA